jgi:hypothetical protein
VPLKPDHRYLKKSRLLKFSLDIYELTSEAYLATAVNYSKSNSILRSKKLKNNLLILPRMSNQGTLTEEEGYVQLASSIR